MPELQMGRWRSLVIACGLLLGCEQEPSASQWGQVQVLARGSSALSDLGVTNVIVTVSGENIPTPLTAELGEGSSGWQGTIVDIPVGQADFHGAAFDLDENVLFAGDSTNVPITAGATAIVGILLQQQTPHDPLVESAPVIDAFTASANLVAPGDSIRVSGIAHDPSGGQLVYAWSADGGFFSDVTSAVSTWTAPDTTGTYNLAFHVTDDADLTASVSFTISVQNGNAAVTTTFNTWPSIDGMTAAPTRIDVGDTTSLSISAADADGDELSYAWATDCSGLFTDEHAVDPQFTLSALPQTGACTFVATVTDARGGSNTGSVTLQAAPAPALTLTAGASTAYHLLYDEQSASNAPYSFDGSIWTRVQGEIPIGVMGAHTLVGVIGGKAYHSALNPQTGTFALYSFDGASWASVESNLPNAHLGRQSYLGVLDDKAYHLVYDPQVGSSVLYAFDGSTWTTVSSNPPSNLGNFSYVGVIGAKAYHLAHDGQKFVYYSFDGSTWTLVEAVAPSDNVDPWSSLGVIDGKAYHWVFNGLTGSFGLYSFDGSAWVAIASNPPSNNLGAFTNIGILNGKAYHWIHDPQTGSASLYSFDGSTWASVASNTPIGINGFFSSLGDI